MAEQGFNVTAVDQSVETTRERCADGTCFIAEIEETMVGTIKLNPTDPESLAPEFHEPNIGIVNQFGVDPEFAGQGIGKALHDAAVAEARRLGRSALLLDTVDGAHELVALYESWGYRTIGRVRWPGKNYESLIMRLDLD